MTKKELKMARPKKNKKVCKVPEVRTFTSSDENDNVITMTVEEYEVIRLMDSKGLKQEECSLQMNVSRPTIQILYVNARKKVAEFLTKGGTLRIEGGSYNVCENGGEDCDCILCQSK